MNDFQEDNINKVLFLGVFLFKTSYKKIYLEKYDNYDVTIRLGHNIFLDSAREIIFIVHKQKGNRKMWGLR